MKKQNVWILACLLIFCFWARAGPAQSQAFEASRSGSPTTTFKDYAAIAKRAAEEKRQAKWRAQGLNVGGGGGGADESPGTFSQI